MADTTGRALEENQLIKGKKNIMALFGNFLAVVICVIIAIVLISNKSTWIEKICASISESMMKDALESGNLTAALQVADTVKTIQKLLKAAFSIVSAALIIFSVIPLLVATLRLACTQLSLTNKRVIGKTGITQVRKTDIKIEDVLNISVTSTLWGRLFKFDTIEIKGKADVLSVTYKGISNAEDIKNAINSMLEQRKKLALGPM